MDDKKKKQSIKKIAQNNFHMVKQIFRFSPMLVVLMLLGGVINGVSSSIAVIFTAQVFEALGRGAEFSEFIPIFILGA